MKKYILTLLFISALFSSCSYDKEWKQQNVKNRFSINLPPFVKEVDDLRKDASLQYANRFRNFYVIVIEHDKSAADLHAFTKESIAPLCKYLDNPIITDSAKVEVNGLSAYENKIMGDMDSGDGKETIYYDHLSVMGKNKNYEVCVWTRGPKRKQQFEADFQKVLFSFKEI